MLSSAAGSLKTAQEVHRTSGLRDRSSCRKACHAPSESHREPIDDPRLDRSGSFLGVASPAGVLARNVSLAAACFWSLDPARRLTGGPFAKPDAALQLPLETAAVNQARQSLPTVAGHLTTALTPSLDQEAP